MNTEELTLSQEWDKTFPKSDKVNHCNTSFPNRAFDAITKSFAEYLQ